MPRVCTICTHKERDAVDAALVNSEPLRTVADRFSVSKSALIRHKAEHLPAALVKAQEAHEAAEADDLLAQVQSLKAKALGILAKAEEAGELRTAISAIREARECVELLGKLAGELRDSPVVNITVNAEWVALRTSILAALGNHPEARLAVVEAIGGIAA